MKWKHLASNEVLGRNLGFVWNLSFVDVYCFSDWYEFGSN